MSDNNWCRLCGRSDVPLECDDCITATTQPCAAGPWHRWPEEKPEGEARNRLVYVVENGAVWWSVMPLHARTPFAPGARVRWAEILPPSEP